MATDPKTLNAFSDRQVLPAAGGNTVLARFAGDAVVLRRLQSPERSLEDIGQRQLALAEHPHPALVADRGVLEQDGQIWVWRDHITGEPASSPALEQRLAFAQRICEALGLLHRRELAHGGVAVKNLLLTPNDGLRLVNFNHQASVSPQQDLVALGGVLFEWETGAAADSTNPQVLAAALTHETQTRTMPPRLARLILNLLFKTPPAAAQVVEELEDIRLSLARADAQVIAHWQTETIAPPARPATPAAVGASTDGSAPQNALHRQAVTQDSPDQEQASQVTHPVTGPPAQKKKTPDAPSKLPMFLATAVFAVLLLGVIFVVTVLPDQVAAPQQVSEPTPPQQAPTPEPAAKPAPPTQAELEQLLQQREAAQAVLDELINLQLQLEEQQVTRWAQRSFGAAQQRAGEGEEPFRAQRFQLAEDIYADALQQMRAIAALAPLVLAEALERGQLALTQGRSADADDAFGLALAIEPDNAQAQAGKARAATLDQVRDLMAQARERRETGQLAAALEVLQQVVGLDPQTPLASQWLQAVRTELAQQAFRDAMSEGLAALNGGRWDAARRALNRASTMQPGSQAPKDALLELERRQRDSNVARDVALAQAAVEQERWEAAIKHFDDVLNLDPNSRLAQEGREQATDRQDLDQRLRDVLNDPAQIWSQQGRGEARSLLYDGRAIANAGPRLTDQLQRLSNQIDLAAQPLLVTLESDNACNVVVYKVARLGQFEERQLELLPGEYTAVGTRDGYRDVRVEFLVPAGQAPEPIELRCVEQVLARG